MSHVDEEPVDLNTDSVVLPTHLSSNMLPTTSDNTEYRTTHEFPEMRTDDESRPQDDQELRDGINEQMNLFWGAVSSAFAEPVEQEEHQQQQDDVSRHEGDGVEVMNVEHQGHNLDGEAPAEDGSHEEPHHTTDEPNQDPYLPEPTQDEPSETLVHQHQDQDQSQDHLTNPADLASRPVEHAEPEHPRNEWEHVQLLMSLGGQLGQDLAALGDGQAGSGELGLQGGIGYPEDSVEADGGHAGQLDDPIANPRSHSHDHDVGNGETPSRPRTRRTIALEEMATVNAEAGPSRLPATVQDPGTSKPRKRAPRSSTATTSADPAADTTGKPKQTRPRAPRKPRQNSAANSNSNPPAPRTLLSQAERRANHVSSEKRRRNAIRIGYAELGALEHMSVNTLWPRTGELEAVIEESKDMEGMEELTGRKRVRVGSQDGDGDRNGDGGGGEGVNGAGEASNGTITKSKRPRKGIYIVNQGMTSKSAILQKGASLAQWLTEGNEWLRGEVERLEGLLGLLPGQALDPQDEVEEQDHEQQTEDVRAEEHDTGQEEREAREGVGLDHEVDYGLEHSMGLGGLHGMDMDGMGELERHLMMETAHGHIQDTHMDEVDVGHVHHQQHQHDHSAHNHAAEHDTREHQLELEHDPTGTQLDYQHDHHIHHHDPGPDHHQQDLEHEHHDQQLHHHPHDQQHQHDEHNGQDHVHHLIDPPTMMEEQFIKAVEALHPAHEQEQIGPDGYPQDSY
jgi:hypothetical protein